MDSIDELGSRPERNAAFTRELLSETDDQELQGIVEEAAKELGTPIALVSLVLEHVQFFRAHYGLPNDLAQARGTHRDVSFCQLVVKNGETFEVNDAAKDERVPQHLVKEYGIAAYLGVPLRVGDTVVGSLCVIDTKPRGFSGAEHSELTRLAALANERVLELTQNRRDARLDMSDRLSGPALKELRDSLAPVKNAVDDALPALTAVGTLLRLVKYSLAGGDVSNEVMLKTLEAAGVALTDCEDLLHDIGAATTECEDCISALDGLFGSDCETRLSDILVAAQDLTRSSTRDVGGAPLPDIAQDSAIHTPRRVAVALCSTCLKLVAEQLVGNRSDGLKLRIYQESGNVVLSVGNAALSRASLDLVSSQLASEIGAEPTVRVSSDETSVLLVFKSARTEEVVEN